MAGDRETDDQPLALLVPFYVNQTLPADDRRRIEAALASDHELRAEVARVRELAELVRNGGPGLTQGAEAASPRRLKAMLARIEAMFMPANSTAPLPTRLWKQAFAAAAALAVVQAGVIAYQATSRTGYATLSGPAAPPARDARRLLLRLAPEARWTQVEALLTSRDLVVVGGPRGGVLDVAVGGAAPLEQEVHRLRASPLVEFAGVAP